MKKVSFNEKSWELYHAMNLIQRKSNLQKTAAVLLFPLLLPRYVEYCKVVHYFVFQNQNKVVCLIEFWVSK